MEVRDADPDVAVRIVRNGATEEEHLLDVVPGRGRDLHHADRRGGRDHLVVEAGLHPRERGHEVHVDPVVVRPEDEGSAHRRAREGSERRRDRVRGEDEPSADGEHVAQREPVQVRERAEADAVAERDRAQRVALLNRVRGAGRLRRRRCVRRHADDGAAEQCLREAHAVRARKHGGRAAEARGDGGEGVAALDPIAAQRELRPGQRQRRAREQDAARRESVQPRERRHARSVRVCDPGQRVARTDAVSRRTRARGSDGQPKERDHGRAADEPPYKHGRSSSARPRRLLPESCQTPPAGSVNDTRAPP